jgi:hypothetical protein
VKNLIHRIATLGPFQAGFPPEIKPRLRVAASCVLLAACNGSDPVALELNGIPSRQISASVGQELRIKLQTIGPGSYASPPIIEGTAVTFLDASIVSPHVPAGPTQVFRFKAVESGRAILAFHNPSQERTVSDTVVVE